MKTLAAMLALTAFGGAFQDPPPLPPKEEREPAEAKDETAELVKELQAAWMKVIDLCREEKKDDLQKVIAAMELTRAEAVELFGEEKAARVHADYRSTWEKAVLVEATPDLIGRFKRNSWNEVEAYCLNDAEEKNLTSDDRGVLGALVNKEATRIFNVRLKVKEGKTAPFLLKCFVKTKAGWKMGLRIGKNLAEK